MDLAESHGGRRGAFAKNSQMASSGSVDKNGKPCRTCTDFQSWMKTGPEKPTKRPTECPADKNELGRASWKFLHTMSVYLPEKELSSSQQSDVQTLIGAFSRLYPCNYCAEDMRADMKDNPPATSSGKDFALWLCGLHNRVNEKLDKPVFDCQRVYERWRDGWKDGSCDPQS